MRANQCPLVDTDNKWISMSVWMTSSCQESEPEESTWQTSLCSLWIYPNVSELYIYFFKSFKCAFGGKAVRFNPACCLRGRRDFGAAPWCQPTVARPLRSLAVIDVGVLHDCDRTEETRRRGEKAKQPFESHVKVFVLCHLSRWGWRVTLALWHSPGESQFAAVALMAPESELETSLMRLHSLAFEQFSP